MEELVRKLEEDLECYDRIFLVPETGKIHGDVLARFCSSEALKDSMHKVLILSAEDLPERKNCSCRTLSGREAEKLKELYFTYEFSDRFRLFSREDCFGGLWNFVETGVLAMEEAFAALLH